MDAQLFQVSSLKMVEEVTLLLLTSKESTLCMMPCHLEASMVEDSPSSVLVYLKELDGSLLTIVMLSLSTMVKVKDAHSLMVNAAAAVLALMNTVLEVAEAALQLVEVEVLAKVILSLKVADITILQRIMTVKMKMDKTMQDSPTWKVMEDQLEVSASQEA